MKSFIILFLFLVGCVSKEPVVSEPPVEDPFPTPVEPVLTKVDKDKIFSIAVNSSCASHSFPNRGKIPAGAIKGLALIYAKNVCAVGNPLLEKPLGDSKDVLVHYGLTGSDKLKSLFTLSFGQAMAESSGRYCEGRDRAASNTSSESAEAGLFQTSWDSRYPSSELLKIFEAYKVDKSKCYSEVFKEGVSCSSRDLENFGSGDGRLFQEMSKSCMAFEVEYSLAVMRVNKSHFGPLIRREAQYYQGCADMLQKVKQYLVETDCKL